MQGVGFQQPWAREDPCLETHEKHRVLEMGGADFRSHRRRNAQTAAMLGNHMRNTDTLGNATAQEAYESMGSGVAIERNTGTLLSKIRETRNKIRETQGPWLGVGVFSSLWDDRKLK